MRKRAIRRFAKRSAMVAGGLGRSPVGSGRNPMQFTGLRGKTMSRKQVGASGARRITAGGLGIIGLSSGSRGRPQGRSSGGRMM